MTSGLALQFCVGLAYQAHVVLRETDEGGNKLLSTGLVWRKKTEELAKDIIRVRTNTVLLIELVSEWRGSLDSNAKLDQKRRVKAIYPHPAISCLLMPL